MAEEMPVADHRDMYSTAIGWLAQISSQTAFFNLKESKKLEHVLLHSWLPWRQQLHVKEKREGGGKNSQKHQVVEYLAA